MRKFLLLTALTLTTASAALASDAPASFAGCLGQVGGEMLPGDCSPLHLYSSGKVMTDPRVNEPASPIASLKNKDAHRETWEIVVPPMAICPDSVKGSKTELTIYRDASGNITSIVSKKFPPPRTGSKALWGQPVTLTANYSYKAGSCQVDQVTKKGMQNPDLTVTTFDRQLCQTVVGIVGQKNPTAISESQRKNILSAMDTRNEELSHDQDVAAPLLYFQNQTGIEDMVPVCEANGVEPVAAATKAVKGTAKKLPYDLPTTGSSD